MADQSTIEWTDTTWNPVAGCNIASAGCSNCYAMRLAARLDAMGLQKYRGLEYPIVAGSLASAGCMAAAAVGLSKNAVLQRRLRHPVFAAKWDAVVRTARALIDLYLVEETNKSFDPQQLGTGEVTPKVTIDQAIKISQIGASKTQREAPPNPFEHEAAPGEVDQLREKLFRKLMRLRDRMRGESLAKGWTLDEENDCLIPPGWVKQSDA